MSTSALSTRNLVVLSRLNLMRDLWHKVHQYPV